MPFTPRPRELKLAIALASTALIFNLGVTIFCREQLGEGWIVWLMFQSLITVVVAVFLVFSYNGRGWVRYFMLVMYSFSYYQVSKVDYRIFFEPITIIGFLLSLSAIAFWFMPSTSRWYKDAYSKTI